MSSSVPPLSSGHVGECIESGPDFSGLPDDSLENIFSRLQLSDQGSVSLVSRRMRDLTFQTRIHECQLLAQGLARKLGRPVDPICVDLLQRFNVNVSWLLETDNPPVQKELCYILSGNLEYLTQPPQLRKFLSEHLLENTREVAKYIFYCSDTTTWADNKAISNCRINVKQEIESSTFERSLEDQIKENQATRAACAEKIQKIIGHFQSKQRERGRIVASGGRGHEGCGFGWNLRCCNLQIPPIQFLHQIGLSGGRLHLHHPSRLSIGVCSLPQISDLRIFHGRMKTLPDKITQMKLEKVHFSACPNLKRLPLGFGAMPFLRDCLIDACPKIDQDPEILKLRERGVTVLLSDLEMGLLWENI